MLGECMGIMTKGYVGKKGEIYIEKRVREIAGLKPGDDLIVSVHRDEIIIKRIPSLNDILSKKPLAIISVEEIEEISREEQKKYEE